MNFKSLCIYLAILTSQNAFASEPFQFYREFTAPAPTAEHPDTANVTIRAIRLRDDAAGINHLYAVSLSIDTYRNGQLEHQRDFDGLKGIDSYLNLKLFYPDDPESASVEIDYIDAPRHRFVEVTVAGHKYVAQPDNGGGSSLEWNCFLPNANLGLKNTATISIDVDSDSGQDGDQKYNASGSIYIDTYVDGRPYGKRVFYSLVASLSPMNNSLRAWRLTKPDRVLVKMEKAGTVDNPDLTKMTLGTEEFITECLK